MNEMNEYNVTLSNGTVKHVFAYNTGEACEKVKLLVSPFLNVVNVYQLQ